MLACQIVNPDTVTFYQFAVAALLAMESLLLTVFGSIFGVYAVYKTLEQDGNESYILRALVMTCQYLSVLISFSALLAIYILVQVVCQPSSQVSSFISVTLCILIVAILIPTIWLAAKMQ